LNRIFKHSRAVEYRVVGGRYVCARYIGRIARYVKVKAVIVPINYGLRPVVILDYSIVDIRRQVYSAQLRRKRVKYYVAGIKLDMIVTPVRDIGIDVKVSGQVNLAGYVYTSPERLAAVEVEVVVYDGVHHQARQTPEFDMLGLIRVVLPDILHVGNLEKRLLEIL